MGSVGVALELLGVDTGTPPPAAPVLGPRGGKTDVHAMRPEYRNASLNAPMVDGFPMLHKGPRPTREEAITTATVGKCDEQPWHRMAAFMLLAGRTNSEIAAAASVGPATVSHLRAQRWFQELLAVLANETGADIVGLLQSEAAASLETLVSLRDTGESERVRLAAALALFEHANGKPVQKVISHSSHSVHATPQDEMDAIQQELAVLRDRNPQKSIT